MEGKRNGKNPDGRVGRNFGCGLGFGRREWARSGGRRRRERGLGAIRGGGEPEHDGKGEQVTVVVKGVFGMGKNSGRCDGDTGIAGGGVGQDGGGIEEGRWRFGGVQGTTLKVCEGKFGMGKSWRTGRLRGEEEDGGA